MTDLNLPTAPDLARHFVAEDYSAPQKIVAIGYSAGGLEPCLRLVESLEPGCGRAYVILPHLSRTHRSLLVEILTRHARLKVCAIHHQQTLRADTIYVLPENKEAEMRGLTLTLLPRPPSAMNCCITKFFTSLATQHGRRAVGVILSGAGVGGEGGTGIERIKNAGGQTFAQDPHTAIFSDMPRQALRTGRVDFCLPADAIGRTLGTCSS